jgi:rhodanese-related sulfurtransferase
MLTLVARRHPSKDDDLSSGFIFNYTYINQEKFMKSAHDLVVAAKGRVREVAITDAEQEIRDASLLIDVREADEYAAGHLPGAIHMSRGMLEFKISSNPAMGARDLRIVIYCKTSGRAALAANALQDMGYLNVSSIAGGFDAWVAAGKPVAKPDVPAFD